MSSGPLVIERNDLAEAWADALGALVQPGTSEIVPLIVTMSGFKDNIAIENSSVRGLVDHALSVHGFQSVRTVANTIFPLCLWNPGLPAQSLFERYSRIAKRLRHYRANRNGIYFERMMAFQPKGSQAEVNQIKYVLETRDAGNHRRSAYQISVVDPTRDDTDQYRRGFPCLQQVAVTPIGVDEIAITGFYATQTIFERAYGNYVGLCNLGRFFAHYWNMRLARVTCVAAIAQLDINKGDGRALARAAKNAISTAAEQTETLVED